MGFSASHLCVSPKQFLLILSTFKTWVLWSRRGSDQAALRKPHFNCRKGGKIRATQRSVSWAQKISNPYALLPGSLLTKWYLANTSQGLFCGVDSIFITSLPSAPCYVVENSHYSPWASCTTSVREGFWRQTKPPCLCLSLSTSTFTWKPCLLVGQLEG